MAPCSCFRRVNADEHLCVVPGNAYQGHLEGAGAETAVHVAGVAGSSADNRAVPDHPLFVFVVPDHPLFVVELWRNGSHTAVACEGIPQNDLLPRLVVEEHATVATAVDVPFVGLAAGPVDISV